MTSWKRLKHYNMYQLKIVTPNGKVFDEQITSLSAPGSEGSFGVLSHHIPIIAQLAKGVLKINTDEKYSFFAINSGVLEVNNQHDVLILSDDAIVASSEENALSLLDQIQTDETPSLRV